MASGFSSNRLLCRGSGVRTNAQQALCFKESWSPDSSGFLSKAFTRVARADSVSATAMPFWMSCLRWSSLLLSTACNALVRCRLQHADVRSASQELALRWSR